MKKRQIFASIGLLSVLLVGAEARTFTNTEGKKIEAELVGMQGEAAILKLGNGRKATVPLKALSEEDQAYVKTWHEENKDKVSESDVRLTIQKSTKKVKESSADDKGKKKDNKSSKSETTYNCVLENLSTKTIENITADYTIYERVSERGEGGSDTRTEETNNSTEVGTLVSSEKLEFASSSEISEDYSKKTKEGTESKRETVVGFVITLKVGDKVFLKQSHPENFLERLEEEAKRQEARTKDRE